MKQVVYLDVYFFVNLIMDYFVLIFTKRIIGIQTGKARCLIGALFGGIISALLYVTLKRTDLVYLIIEYILTVIFMNEVAFKPKTVIGKFKCFFCVYFVAVLLGGITYFLYYYSSFCNVIKNTFTVMLCGKYGLYKLLGSVLVVYAIFSILIDGFLYYRKPIELKRYKIYLYILDNVLEIWGIYDTGNSLKESVTGEMVHIAGEKALSIVDNKYDIKRKFMYVSYSSVGNENGILESILFDKMEVYTEDGEKIYESNNPRIAIAKDNFLKEEYEIILNKEIFMHS